MTTPTRTADRARSSLLAELLASSHHEDGAFAEFYALTSHQVHGVVLKVLRSSDLATDVTQDVYLEVWRQAGRFSVERGDVMAWMATIAYRRAVDRVRSVVSQKRRDGDWCRRDVTTPYDQVSETADLRGDADRVLAELTRLNDIQRQAVELAYFGGCTQREVADRLQLPLGTAKWHLRTALAILRAALT